MKKRQFWKNYRKPLQSGLYYCPNWRSCSGTNDQPSVKYCKKECGENNWRSEFEAKAQFVKLMKREGFSISGWKLEENPAAGVYIFLCRKKGYKEITLKSHDNQYRIEVFDPLHYKNVEMKNMKAAFSCIFQNAIYCPSNKNAQSFNIKRRNKYKRNKEHLF